MTESLKKYSLEEISKNDGSNGSRVWIVVKDKVIDVTDYLDEHPGGGELITEYAGKDATKAYNDAGHSSDADKELKRFVIGELIDEDKRANRGKAQKSTTKQTETEKTSSHRSFLSIISCGTCG